MGYCILIVDDSATTRAIIKRTIRLANLPADRVLEAADGKQALELMATTPVDLVLADLHMPVMDGVEMTRRMREGESTRSIPVIVISAEPNAERISRLMEQDGVRAHLRKPFTPEDVRYAVSRVMEVAHA